ncbi:AbrB/MazE/SpoVT family DNA-binding domain-containing protein [Streptomyces sp. NPDC060194]|uniref:AbrB/MazE/SpoVT family DNA-binding domain-containing protein n=1 Tax=Streptomyces sp. NPDC060194 TaxID=3347069 RepID=UPI00366A0AE4
MALDTRIRAQLREKGQLTLPSEIRRALHIEPGDDVEFVVREGQVILRGLTSVPADQAWFWTEEWQAGEREASEQIARGEGTVHGSAEEMFAALGVPDAEPDRAPEGD